MKHIVIFDEPYTNATVLRNVFFCSHDYTDSPSDSTEVITVIDSFKSKIIKVRVSTWFIYLCFGSHLEERKLLLGCRITWEINVSTDSYSESFTHVGGEAERQRRRRSVGWRRRTRRHMGFHIQVSAFFVAIWD